MPKLTIEQALRQGIAAHKDGKLQEAERLYRAILEVQPAHPDANHNLGVLAVADAKTEAALPLFKTALEANPKVEQFWLSYIDALIKEKQFETAKQFLEQAKNSELPGDKINALMVQLSKISEREISTNANPSEEQLKTLLKHYQAGQYGDAEKLASSITQEFPENQFAWKVLGVVFKQTGRVSESLVATHKSVQLSPQDPQAHNNLGNTLKELGRLDEAEESYAQALALNPDFAEAHNNLGATLQELGRLEEAEVSYMQALVLNPDFAHTHNDLGATLQELGRLDEAEASLRQAIALKPDFAVAHSLLGCIMHEKGEVDSALHCFKKAFNFDSNLRINELRLKVLKSRATHKRALGNSDIHSEVVSDSRLHSNPLILHRVVEGELIEKLYEMTSRALDSGNDARYGSGSCSLDFRLFENESSIIKTVSLDLTRIASDAVKSKIYVYDSFFNILGAGGGSKPHDHIKKHDNGMDLWKQKYSLVYYISAGDQNCNEPGVLKLYSPDEDILPCEGMIVIVPATRQHSAIYGGKADRIMIGVNFYAF